MKVNLKNDGIYDDFVIIIIMSKIMTLIKEILFEITIK